MWEFIDNDQAVSIVEGFYAPASTDEELRRSRLVVSEVGLSDGEAQGGEG